MFPVSSQAELIRYWLELDVQWRGTNVADERFFSSKRNVPLRSGNIQRTRGVSDPFVRNVFILPLNKYMKQLL